MSFDLKLTNGDLVIKNGDLDIVEDSDKLIQDVLKIISTEVGSNPFFPNYGSNVGKFLLGTSYDEEFVQNISTQQLRTTLENLQKLQNDQLKQNQIVTPSEQIAAIEDIRITQDNNDPRLFYVYVVVISKAFKQIPVSFNIVL